MSAPVFVGVDLSNREDVCGVIWMRDKTIVPREAVARCAVCGNAQCDHSDLAFAGIVPPAVLS
jgi:acyl dehydratase